MFLLFERRRIRPALLRAFWVICALTTAAPVRADDAAEVRALMARGDSSAALKRVDQALGAHPTDVPLRFLQGVVLMDLALDDQALAVFTRLSQEHPDLPDPLNNIGLLQARAGRLDEALASIQEALRSDPSHRTARANLGQVYLMLAVRTWDELSRSGPVDASLQRRLEAARVLLLPAGGGAAR